jgi:hypothetical protein
MAQSDLDLAAGDAFHRSIPMRSFLLALCAVACLCPGPASSAAPRKKPVTAPLTLPRKTPPGPASATAGEAPSGEPAAAPVRGPTRIDFDDRLIQGQTNKSGAVYLYDRKELKIRSMIKKRENFRDEIVGSLYDP